MQQVNNNIKKNKNNLRWIRSFTADSLRMSRTMRNVVEVKLLISNQFDKIWCIPPLHWSQAAPDPHLPTSTYIYIHIAHLSASRFIT